MSAPGDRMTSAPATLQSYPGAKGGNGVAERIISLMPVHSTYVELCCGSAVVFRKKRPAAAAILADLDPEIVSLWAARFLPATVVIKADATEKSSWPPSLKAATLDPNTLLYCDPPYLSTPTVNGNRYPCRLDREEDHRKLIGVLRQLPCRVMLSGYASPLYNDLLRDWRCVAFSAATRGSARIECVWLNFPEGLPLHDTRFVGLDRRDRERIKRKRDRWRAKFEAMRPDERQVIYEALLAVQS